MMDLAKLARAKRLDPDELRRWGVDDLPGGGIGITYYDESGEPLFIRKRDVPGANRRFEQPAGVRSRPYGLNRLADRGQSAELYLTEGESDCWALWSAGLPALGVPGWANAGCLSAECLVGVETLTVCLDNDDGGRRFCEAVLKRLVALGYGGTACAVSPPPGVKDVCDLYARDPQGFAGAFRQLERRQLPLPARPARPAEPPAIEPEAWPAPPGREALHGLAGEVVRLIDPQTEADPVAVLAQFLVAFGNAVGRAGFRAVGARRHYPNLFLVLVGASSRGRKGTAWDWVESLFKEADPGWAASCIQAGLSSGEGLIQAVRDPRFAREGKGDGGREVCVDQGATDKRLLVVEEEFSSTLRVMSREGSILSAVMRQAWDGGRLRTLTKVNPLRATDAHISIVGHITRPELSRLLSETDHANGFANRILWLASRRSKLLPDGGTVPPGWPALAASVGEALRRARNAGQLGRTAAAARLWRERYVSLTAERPGAFGLVTSRAEAQCLRLSLLYALLDGSDEIGEEHLRAALALWEYSEDSCRWLFGTSTGNADADEILDALRAAGPAGMTTTEISALFGRHRSAASLRAAMSLLAGGGLAASETASTRGRPITRWYAQTGETREKREITCATTTYGDSSA